MSRSPFLSLSLALILLTPGVGNAEAASLEGEPIQIGESFTMASKILDQERRFNVFLPTGYAEGNDRYPVLYLLDGGMEEDFLHIVGIAALAADFRKIRPFVVIGIEGIDRYHDLIHPSEVVANKKDYPTSGGSADFRRFLAEELMPLVEKRFRLTDERVLMGESAAGLFVTETFLRAPELFSGYIAVSPSLWWNDQSLSRESKTLLKNEGFPAQRQLYLTIADEGGTMRKGMDRLVKTLEKQAPKDLTWTFRPMEHETHGTIFHPAALEAVRVLFATQ